MDPATVAMAASVAAKSFAYLKKGFQIGKDLQSMQVQLSDWMDASSEIAELEKSANNASGFSKLLRGAGNIEKVAVQSAIQKTVLEKQRTELKSFIILSYGMGTWDNVLKTEGRLRKAKQAEIERQEKLKEKITLYSTLTVALALAGSLLWYFGSFLKGLNE